jgi:hypothetical protein
MCTQALYVLSGDFIAYPDDSEYTGVHTKRGLSSGVFGNSGEHGFRRGISAMWHRNPQFR